MLQLGLAFRTSLPLAWMIVWLTPALVLHNTVLTKLPLFLNVVQLDTDLEILRIKDKV